VLRLAAQVKKEHKIKMDVKEIITDVTPHPVAQVVAGKHGVELSVAAPPQEAHEHVDWRAEAKLPGEPSFYPSAEASSVAPADGTAAAYILPTGADSATGVHLLGRNLNVLGPESAIVLGDVHSRINDHGTTRSKAVDLASRVDLLPRSLCEPGLRVWQMRRSRPWAGPCPSSSISAARFRS
jgi:hypothetical protein